MSLSSTDHRGDAKGFVIGSGGQSVLNAFWAGDYVMCVTRDAAGQRIVTRRTAEHSVFLRKADVPAQTRDRLRSHPLVVRMVEEPGGWLRVCWRSREDLAMFCNSARSDGLRTYEGFVNPVLRWMADERVSVTPPRIAWVDLEADSRVPFRRKEEGRTLAWAVCDEQRLVASACLVADTDQRERDLYGQLWDVLEDYDLVAAWNGDRFDFPVIHARSNVHGLLSGKRDPRRWLWLDHLELYRRMNMSASESGDEKQSMKLDEVSSAVLGNDMRKLDFDASKTWEAWKAGGEQRKRLVAYNERDTQIMPAIEAKTGYIRLLLTLGEVCGTFADSRGVNPTVQVEGFLQRLAVDRGHKFTTKMRSKAPEQFKGALVMEPRTRGIVKDIHVCDFAAMYPSIIRTWNMSPETIVEPDEWAKADAAGVPMSHSPKTNEYFYTETEGVLGAAVGELMRLRKVWNAKKDAEPPGTEKWKEYDRRATAYKIATNSFYGCIGAPYGRFFQRRVAESVTQCGVWLIENTLAEAERLGMSVVYADTDSAFIEGATRAQFEAFVKGCNEVLYPRILKEVGCRENHIKLAYEKQFARVVFSAGKRYIGSFVHYKGKEATADSKPEVKGIEFKRGDTLRFARQMQEKVAHLIVGYKCTPSDEPADYEAILEKWRKRILEDQLTLADVMLSKRLNKSLEEYVVKQKKDGTEGSAQPHIRLARILEARGADVAEGAKIDYVVVGPEDKPQRVVLADDWDGTIDRGATWRRVIAPPTVRLLEAAFPDHDWSRWEKEGLVKKPRAKRKVKQNAEAQSDDRGIRVEAEVEETFGGAPIARRRGRKRSEAGHR